VRVAIGRRAEPVRVHVHRLQARREGAGHVVAQAVSDVQDRTVRWHAKRIEREAEDGRVGFGHADHGGVEDDAHFHPGRRSRLVGGGRDVADAEAAQVALHAAVGVGDHAHRQAERGHRPQAVQGPEADVRPAMSPGPLGQFGGDQFGPVRFYTAGRDVAEQVVAPPRGRNRRRGLSVLERHRVVVGPLQRAQVGVHPGDAQLRQQAIGFGKDQYPAGIEQDGADLRR
jgi:hypothetical protein